MFAASIHLALNLPNAVFQESVRAYYSTWYRDLVTVMPRIEHGLIYPLERLGTELAPDVQTRKDAIVRRTTAAEL